MREAFAMQKLHYAKASHIFSTKNIGIFEKWTYENLTKGQLMTSLALNNRAQIFLILLLMK